MARSSEPEHLYHQSGPLTLLQGDAFACLLELPDDSVHMAITSPPYFGLRVYGDADVEIGREPTLSEYIANLKDVFWQVRRVLHPDGTFWLNISDSYANTNRQGHKLPSDKSTLTAFRHGNRPPTHQSENTTLGDKRRLPPGLKTKDLIPVSWTLAIAMQQMGWYLRAPVIWHKPNVIPSSAKDRPGIDHEYVFMFTKSPRYYFNMDAVKQPAKWERWGRQTVPKHSGTATGPGWIEEKSKEEVQALGNGERNLRTVWTIPTSNFPGQHFATFPPALVERCILASCPPQHVVLDPFIGSGTTAMQAIKMGRSCVGIDLYSDLLDMTIQRVQDAA